MKTHLARTRPGPVQCSEGTCNILQAAQLLDLSGMVEILSKGRLWVQPVKQQQ